MASKVQFFYFYLDIWIIHLLYYKGKQVVWPQKYNFWIFTWIILLFVCCIIKENKQFGLKSTIFRLIPGYKLWIVHIWIICLLYYKGKQAVWPQKYNFFTFTWIFGLFTCCIIKENKEFGLKNTIFRLLPGYKLLDCAYLDYLFAVL